MPLPDAVEKKNIGREIAREMYATKAANLGSDVIEAALDAAFDWLTPAILTSLNSAFPVAFRNTATQKEKAAVLVYAVRRKVADL